MNKKALIIVLILATVAGGVFFLSQNKESSPVAPSSQNTPAASQGTSEQQPTNSSKPGQYVDYQDNIIASTPGTKILFFHAAWCPQCRTLERDINTGEIPSDVTIIKVDYDTNQALRKQYGVTLQTTLVKVADDGSLVKKYVAYDDPTLASLKANLL